MLRGSASNRVVPDEQENPGTTWMSSPRTPKRKIIVKRLVPSLPSPRSPQQLLKSLRNVANKNRNNPPPQLILTPEQRNLTQFLTTACPTDVLPKILAHAGPTAAAALQQTSRHFHTLLDAEGTWRGLCEELYKWKQGDPEPVSWKEHYRLNPCVPVDFSCVHTALAMAGAGWTRPQVQKLRRGKGSLPVLEITKNITVWVRPGRYELTESVAIATAESGIQVRIQRMHVPQGRVYRRLPDAQEASLELHASAHDVEGSALVKDKEQMNDVIIENKSRRRNEPLIRLFCGQLTLERVELEHYCPGVDIWNGNAAIQIQPAEAAVSEGALNEVADASAVLNRVDIRSFSGRGIVAMDGGHVRLQDCHIHHCAATGVYIGSNCQAHLQSTDILSNGLGNQRAGGAAVARGHSGLYIEQGTAQMNDCSVSDNTAAGISVIASDNTALQMTNSEAVANGCTPLELPNPTNAAVDPSNRLAVVGTARPRCRMLRR